MFRAGDEIMAVDGVALDGKNEIEAKRMFLGHDGSIMQLSVLRPSTGKHFSVSLRRHVLTEDAASIET
jgi:C-terminal processing protease CtpA/Prc